MRPATAVPIRQPTTCSSGHQRRKVSPADVIAATRHGAAIPPDRNSVVASGGTCV